MEYTAVSSGVNETEHCMDSPQSSVASFGLTPNGALASMEKAAVFSPTLWIKKVFWVVHPTGHESKLK